MSRVLCGGKANADGITVYTPENLTRPKPDGDPFMSIMEVISHYGRLNRDLGRAEERNDRETENALDEAVRALYGRLAIECRLAIR